MTTWHINETQILTRSEIVSVLASLRRRAKRSNSTKLNLTLFRLATCCGLRVSEACTLKLSDVRVGVERPYLDIRKAVGKGRKARRVPLWWDRGTLEDLTVWKNFRLEQGATQGDLFLCSQRNGQKLSRVNARCRFVTACQNILGADRKVTIHHGRHSFISHALAGGRTLAEVKAAAGHANIATTSIYTHIAVSDDGTVADLFAFTV